MKYLRPAYLLFIKNIFMNIIIIIQIICFLSILTFMSSNIEEINKDNNHLKNLYKENMVYFSHASLLNNEEDDINLISNNKCYSMYKTVGYLDDNLCNIYVMDRFIYSRLNFSLSKGSNFSQKLKKV